MSEASGKIIKLVSSDNVVFEVDIKVAEKSIVIKNMLDDLSDGISEVPLSNVSSNVLQKVIEYCRHHQDDTYTAPEDSNERARRSTDISEWDQRFLTVDQEMLFEIILTANYLDIKPLLEVGCKMVANMIKGKTPEEIRRTFNIENDFTQEEEAQIRRENEWAEDR